MLFWVGVAAVLLVVGLALCWGLRGYEDREHRPGSQRLRPPAGPAAGGRGTRP